MRCEYFKSIRVRSCTPLTSARRSRAAVRKSLECYAAGVLALLIVAQLASSTENRRVYEGPRSVEAGGQATIAMRERSDIVRPTARTRPRSSPTPVLPDEPEAGPSSARLGGIYSTLAGGFGVVGVGIATWRGVLYATCPSSRTTDECDFADAFLLESVQAFANVHAFAFAGAASGAFGRNARDSRRVRRRLTIAGATSLTIGVALGASAYGLGFANLKVDDRRTAERRWAGQVAMGELGAVASIAGVVMLARIVAQKHERREPAGKIYAGLAIAFAGVGVGIASYRGWLYSQCPSYSSVSDCDFGDFGLAAMQTFANLHAFAFAGASGAMFGRRASDSHRTRTRFVVAGTSTLTIGVLLGVASYPLVFVGQQGIPEWKRWGAVRIAIGELGAAAAVAGVVLLARVIAQKRLRRERVALAVAPIRGGASVSLGGRF